MYTQTTAIIFDHSRLGLENKFFLTEKTQSPTYDHLYWTTPKYNFYIKAYYKTR